MEKFYINDESKLNEEEKKSGYISYGKIIDRYIGNKVLCNNIENIDNTIWDNLNSNFSEDTEIYQYFLCNLSDFETEILNNMGIILSYSNLLECDVLLVDHYGTNWDYVLSDVKWTTNFEEVK